MLSRAGGSILVGEFHISISLILDPPCNHGRPRAYSCQADQHRQPVDVTPHYSHSGSGLSIQQQSNVPMCDSQSRNTSFPDALLWEAADADWIFWSGPGPGLRSSCEAIQDKKEHNSQISFSIKHHLFSGKRWRVRQRKWFTKGFIMKTNCPENDKNVLGMIWLDERFWIQRYQHFCNLAFKMDNRKWEEINGRVETGFNYYQNDLWEWVKWLNSEPGKGVF